MFYKHKKLSWVNSSKRKFLIILVFLFLISVILGEHFAGIWPTLFKKDDYYQADKINKACASEIIKENCYQKQLYILTQKAGLISAINTLQKLQIIDPQNATSCHFIAHRIAQAETENRPKEWVKIAKAIPQTQCSGGFLHGVLEAHIGADSSFQIDSKSITKLCESISENNDLFQLTNCAHNMGHLLLVQDQGNIQKATKECEKITFYEVSLECSSGVYMESFTMENLLAHGIIKKKLPWNIKLANVVKEQCEESQGVAAVGCWKELAHLYSFVYKNDPREIYLACQQATPLSGKDECFLHAVGIIVTSPDFNDHNLPKVCTTALSPDLYRKCVAGVIDALLISSLTNRSRAVGFCVHIENPYRKTCNQEIQNALIRYENNVGFSEANTPRL